MKWTTGSKIVESYLFFGDFIISLESTNTLELLEN